MITVRNAIPEDIPRILEMFNESITPVWSQSAIQAELEKSDSFFLVAVCDEVVGFAVIRQVGDDGELLQIATCPTVRRTGVGDALLCAVIGFAAKEKYKNLHLEVRKSNEPAINLYKKHGFERVRTRTDYYNSPPEDAIVMVRSFSI